MPQHKYRTGDAVIFAKERLGLSKSQPIGVEVIRQLATDGDDPEYRVKSPDEGVERVVRESQLAPSLSENPSRNEGMTHGPQTESQ
jgi:hypothetical protein